ncbi:hypothetical protein SPRG_13970 [Saprolegnia parasitica CBS 223.65]|uniref:Endonuclease/exonuclease/phosphatase domain-containing protein n=1 Tax=Saprolegnia parasitica (strain CBS 223.65) TaxID=695850 RepID=A0A067BNU1_SAPPC|nr:hypothetical protein SPRG_13970 [Saprolegnia parasitica CBS 223.65]KDO20144.1 hypothetical protein SPRG_13970 [Saprolegnia parasitica CBS 223.65]|eukprot:XP_012209138.1 hypothetical protein SPRG_13970 [Saprolegnia parasitica CBS 223.65]
MYEWLPSPACTKGGLWCTHAPITDLIQVHVPEPASELDIRYDLARGRCHDKVLYLHNMYAPAEREAFFAALPKRFEPDAVHIVGGDFNVILSEALDSFEPLPKNLQIVEQLLLWLRELRQVDAYRQDYPTTISLCTLAPRPSQHTSTPPDHSACTFELSTRVKPRTGPWRAPHWLAQLPVIIDECLDQIVYSVSIGPVATIAWSTTCTPGSAYCTVPASTPTEPPTRARA